MIATIQDFLSLIWVQIKQYFYAQSKLFLVSLIILSIGLYLLNVPLFFLVAVMIAIFDIMPIVGSALVFIPWSIYHWSLGDTSMGWYLLLLFFILEGIQLLLEPVLIGKDMELPLWQTIIVTILSSIIFKNIFISLLALPVFSATQKYLKEEKWRKHIN